MNTLLTKYAQLALNTGVNLQKNQGLLIQSPIEAIEFARIVVKQAYQMGAKNVHVEWKDDELTYLKMKHAPIEVLESFPEWRKDAMVSMVKQGYAVLNIYGENPDLLKDIEGERMAAVTKASSTALKEYRDYMMNDKARWSIVGYPTTEWAEKIFPDVPKEEAKDKLWKEIFRIARVDQSDPIAAWKQHNQLLKDAREYLNNKNYHKLYFQAEGTDLTIELPEGHIWHGGGAAKAADDVTFNPNIPTEEVFSMPHKYGVNGQVTSTKPLSFQGQLIENFTLTFKDGKVVDYTCEKGEQALKQLLEADEDGASRLGEVALVPHESPVSQSGIIFFNTLFDENASCHIALGKAYPTNIKGGSDMSEEEMDQHGVNDSIVHEDFMIGSQAMNIDGITASGEREAIFRNGTWAIHF
ncbi:aminopeptidase S [Gracilibacillus boraciitolerans JCM 21714]|uniref:Aminopeptidase S n=1 Tax=Gracilibacillus boraciitolerans JCM 21714 TaxID=1298598 RepID=W4VIC8_9BACI|nr:aminopeptidase [Gracilibacillus boraciitolerans]GAE92573.1 aminopeptidase S [Gracilibacillus boraciitolerans JCM 21714]